MKTVAIIYSITSRNSKINQTLFVDIGYGLYSSRLWEDAKILKVESLL